MEKQAFAKASQCALGPRNSTAKHGELVFYYSPVDATELTNVEVILKALEFFFGDVAQVDGVRDGRTRAGQVSWEKPCVQIKNLGIFYRSVK